MKKHLAIAALSTLALTAHAESFFQVEAGLGGAKVQDIGDGTWQQWGAPFNKVNLQSPVVSLGFTGQVWQRNRWDLRYHVNYVYVGEYSASCHCAEHDEDYDLPAHKLKANATLGYYNGHGHLNGVALTLEPGYTYSGYRFAVEGGLWAYQQTWNQYAQTSFGSWNLQTPKTIHIGYVAGARIERGNFSVSYRYYQVKQDWSTGIPGLAGGVHAFATNYRF